MQPPQNKFYKLSSSLLLLLVLLLNMGISRCTLTFAAEHVRSFETVITLFTPSTLSSCHMTLAFALPNSCVTRFNRSQSAICITVTWLASQRVFHLKIKCKGFTVITIIPSHVVLTHAVRLKRKKSQVTISLSVLKQWNLLTQKQIIVLIDLYTADVHLLAILMAATQYFRSPNS